MDRPIDAKTKRRRRLKHLLTWGVPLFVCVGLFYGVGIWIEPSVERNRVRLGQVDRGTVEASLTTTGQVIPSQEGVITRAYAVKIIRVLEQPGALVEPGQALLQLETTEQQDRLDTLAEQAAMKRNAQKQASLEIQKDIQELQGALERLKVQLAEQEFDRKANHRLFQKGYISVEAWKESQTQTQLTRIAIQEHQQNIGVLQQLQQAQAEGLRLELKSLERQRKRAHKRLEAATVRAEQTGVITWIWEEVGATAESGKPLVRIADLTRFHVEAAISDSYANRVHVGQLAQIRVNELPLAGTVQTLLPQIENGRMTLKIQLQQPSHERLKPNLRVDVWLVTDNQSNTLRVPRGAFANGHGWQDVFVVEGEYAYRRPVQLGLVSADHYAVLSGLQLGETVIVSSTHAFADAEKIHLK